MAALASHWLSYFRLLLWNRWMEFNETWQEARSQRPLPSLRFSGRLEKQDGRPGLGLAETFSTSPLKPLNRIQRHLTGSKISTSSTKFVFFVPIGKTLACRPGLWLAETFSTSPLKPLNGIQRHLTGSKISTSSTKFVFFGPIGKTRWPLWPLIGWDIFNFSSETAEHNSTTLDRKQDLNILYQVCVFQADREKKMAVLASDWLRHFRLLLWNRWTEFNKTWQEARSERPLPSLCFSGRSEKQDGRPGLWLAETFLTSPLKPLNGIQRNLTGSKISTSSTKFVFSGRSEKQDGRPGLGLAETFSTSPLKPLNGIQRNLTGSKISTSSTKFVFFRPITKNKMAVLASDWLRHFRLLSMSSTKFVFFGPISEQKCPPWPISQRGGTLYSGARYVALWASCFPYEFDIV